MLRNILGLALGLTALTIFTNSASAQYYPVPPVAPVPAYQYGSAYGYSPLLPAYPQAGLSLGLYSPYGSLQLGTYPSLPYGYSSYPGGYRYGSGYYGGGFYNHYGHHHYRGRW